MVSSVFGMWCARQESNLLPFYAPSFRSPIAYSLGTAECRRLSALISPIAVRESTHYYHITSSSAVIMARGPWYRGQRLTIGVSVAALLYVRQ